MLSMRRSKRERQADLVEQGAGNAVADLKAGYGQEGRMEQAVERGRQVAEAIGAAAPEFPAAEVAGNFQMAADAGAVPVVEQGDGWYWMRRARRAEERLREVSRLVGELEGLLKGQVSDG